MSIEEKETIIYERTERKRRPAHPGIVLEGILEDLNITQTQLAKDLGVSRRTISLIIHGRQPVTVDMALRLGKWCGNGPGIWLNIQRGLDLWDAQHKNKKVYARIKAVTHAA